MVDDIAQVVVDSSPLIYLAKLQALDVLEQAGLKAVLPPGVVNEVATSVLAYVHPDAAAIKQMIEERRLTAIPMTGIESKAAEALRGQQSGVGLGEAQVLAVAAGRGLPAAIHERRGRTIARVLGVQLIDMVELLISGTSDFDLASDRVRRFAGLVNMRLADYDALRQRIERRRLR